MSTHAPTTTQLQTASAPTILSRVTNSATSGQWNGIRLEHSQQQPDESIYKFNYYTVIVSLGPPRLTEWRFDGGKLAEDIIVPGCVSIFAPNQDVWVRWHTACEHVVLTLDNAVMLRTVEEFQLNRGPFLGQNAVIEDQLVVQMSLALKKEAEQYLPHGSLYGDQMSGLLLHHLLRNYPSRTQQARSFHGGMTPRNLRQVLSYIEEHLHADLKLAQLAQLVGMSPQHFARTFKQETGLPPYRYVIERRIARAKDLLRNTKEPVGDIAFAVGFDSPSHFGKHFRSACRMTPNDYRRSI